MKKETLERLLNEACELLIIFEEGNIANVDDQKRITAIFNEIKYSDKIDSEMQEDTKVMTAVEFLIQQILKHDKSFIEFYNAEIEQALELEKQQIENAYDYYRCVGNYNSGIEYYNEIHKK
jgi:hypothetical protein